MGVWSVLFGRKQKKEIQRRLEQAQRRVEEADRKDSEVCQEHTNAAATLRQAYIENRLAAKKTTRKLVAKKKRLPA
jgi:guanylate kinase